MTHPDGIPVEVLDGDGVGDEVHTGGRLRRHLDTLTGGEGVAGRVRLVSAADTKHEFVDLLGDPLHHGVVALVIGLEATDVEPPGHIRAVGPGVYKYGESPDGAA